MQSLRLLTLQNIEFLDQGRRLIVGLTDELYCNGVPPVAHSGVGSHFRHCLDFYRCFLAGLETGRVDYDARSRDRETEKSRERAAAAIEEIIGALRRIAEETAPDHSLEISVDCPSDHQEIWSRSTVLREMQTLTTHTVHHYALISMLLRLQGQDPGAEFGIAPSTLKFEKLSLQCAG